MSEYAKSLKELLSRNRFTINLALILIIAFILRLWGIDWGLPYIYHTDEWQEVRRALKLGAGVFDFERVHKGGYFYILFMEYGIYFVVLKILGLVKSGDDFLFKFFQDPTTIWLIGRITTAAIGTLNCYVLYLLGKHIYSRNVGLFASFFMAINLIHVRSSHFITVDVLLTCLITICFLIMCWKPKSIKFTIYQYCMLGIFSAFAVMTKTPAAVVVLTVLVFHFINLKSELASLSLRSYLFDKRLLYFVIIFSAVFILGNPGFILHLKNTILWLFSFFSSIDGNSQTNLYPHLNRPKSLFQYYFNVIFPVSYMVMNIVIFGGIIVSFIKRYSFHFLFLSFLIPYFFFLCTSKSVLHVFPRYVLPLTPLFFIYAGLLIDHLIKKFGRISYIKFAIAALLVLAVLPITNNTFALVRDYSKPDTRTLAKAWVDENIPANSIIIIEGRLYSVILGTVPLKIKPSIVDEVMAPYINENNYSESKGKFYEILKKSLKTQKTYHLILIGNRKQLLDALNNRNVDYVILRERALTLGSYKEVFPEMHRLISWVNSKEFELIKLFEQDKKTRGPKLRIYKRNHN